MRRFTLLALLASAAFPAGAAAADANFTFKGQGASLRTCHAKQLAQSSNVRTGVVRAARTGLVWATTQGTGDWDIAIFDRKSGRLVAASASPNGSEIAQGFAVAGTELLVQACLVNGADSTVKVALGTVEQELRTGERDKVMLVKVKTLRDGDREMVERLGLDEAHKGSPQEMYVVVDGAAELAKIKNAGLRYEIEVGDLVADFFANRREEARWAARTKRSAFPSGRTEYRRLADYEAEMKKLAAEHPGLVKLITLKEPSLEGRDILGLEIGKNVNVPDGKPTFVQFGVHHAREWPAAELPMEWAYELINNYGKDDRVTKLVNATRNVIVPLINPDGFNLTRESTVDLGNLLASIDIPKEIDSQLPIQDPTYIAAILADQQAGTFAYKRRNCRIKDGSKPEPGECGDSANRNLGTDPNRNYGGLWGGPGASFEPDNDTYRGAGPFSEPETQNVQHLMSTRQVATMITNHTFTGLVLRPPGIRQLGTTVDEPKYKALGDAMAAQNGYISQYGYQLYDTTGTTEDWSYAATGGFGFTFEIGPDEFHPPYPEVVAEWDGSADMAKAKGGKGNREAYYIALEHTANAKNHSVLKGKAPKGVTLRLHKEFDTSTSPVIQDTSGKTNPPLTFRDVLDTTLPMRKGGRFTWHVNPSTRPIVALPRRTGEVNKDPAVNTDVSSTVPTPPGIPREIEFEVKPGQDRQIRISLSGVVPVDDYDIYLYEKSVAPENQIASSASASSEEVILYNFPNTGKFILQIVNYSAVGPYNGFIQLYGAAPGTEKIIPARTERWTFTCERKGKVLRKQRILVKRGQAKNLGANVCKKPRRKK